MREDSPPVSLSNSALAAGYAVKYEQPAAGACQSAVQPALKGHVGAVEDIPGAAAAVRAYYPHAVIGKPP